MKNLLQLLKIIDKITRSQKRISKIEISAKTKGTIQKNFKIQKNSSNPKTFTIIITNSLKSRSKSIFQTFVIKLTTITNILIIFQKSINQLSYYVR
ncbi:unnamed protein product [Paramecium pentaurelia]|uniref:Uncharacterized protein n=1 Tax=Paramecium pentaurelia TaxID=43138 RepID=A0A8S1U4G2_9CILI|nr:unnamed protein product [Paramecium pentaurelia]